MLHLHVQYIFHDFQPDVPVAYRQSIPESLPNNDALFRDESQRQKLSIRYIEKKIL